MTISDLTPIRIRGKRGAKPEEKWSLCGRRRQPPTAASESPRDSVGASTASSRASSARPGKQKRRKRENARLSLETLPTEILQMIFEFSENVNLPMTTVGLARSLNSKHLFLSLTDSVLGRVFGLSHDRCPGSKASEEHLAAATRLLDSRFMTLSFFENWMNAIGLGETADLEPVTAFIPRRSWRFPYVSQGLLPPPKLLQGPWTIEKLRFYDQLFSIDMPDLIQDNLNYVSIVQKGLAQAIAAQSVGAVKRLVIMASRDFQEPLRQAVVDDGCIREIVQAIFDESCHGPDLDLRWAVRSRGPTTLDCPG